MSDHPHPHDLDAEKAVLGAILAGSQAMPLALAAVDFCSEQHAVIYQACVALHNSGTPAPADLVTVTNHLHEHSQLKRVGGASYVSSLIDASPDVANVAHYAEIVRKKAVERRLIKAAQTIAHRPGQANQAINHIIQLADDMAATPEPFSVDRLRERIRNQPAGKPSPWHALDSLDVSFRPGEFAIIAGRTGHGKTTFLLNLLLYWLQRYPDENFVFATYELPPEAVALKFASTLTAVQGGDGWSYSQIRDHEQGRDPTGGPNDSELGRAWDTLKTYENRLDVVYKPWNVDDLTAYIRKTHRQRPISGAVVDYLQLVPPPQGKHDRRDIEVSQVARRLKRLAVDCSCPVIVAAQLNRDPVAGKDPLPPNASTSAIEKHINKRRPELHHLREGGSEQYADLALGLLNFAVEQNEPTTGNDSTTFRAYVLKNRFGTTGTANLRLQGRTGLITDEDHLLFERS